MLIGICSDSHGRHEAVAKALEIFRRQGVDVIVHCGDVGGREVFEVLAGNPVHFVWGNTDFPDATLLATVKDLELPVPPSPPLRLELNGKRIAVFHGHEKGFSRAHLDLEVDYVFCGHSHQRKDERLGKVRRINPGALFRVATKTVATLDLETDTLASYEVP